MVQSMTGEPGKSTRVKTDLRLPRRLVRRVEALCCELGIPKNAFFTLAGARLLMELAPLSGPAVKREYLIADLEKIFQRVIKKMREQL